MSVLRRMVQADEMADVLEDMRGRVIDCPVTYCKGVGRRIDERS